MMINNPSFYVYRMDRCQNCGNQSLELYDYFNNPQGYKKIADLIVENRKMPASLINSKAFYTFRCKQCGKTYPIVWVNGFPIPDFSSSYAKEFMDNFGHMNDLKRENKKSKKNKGRGK